jgi:hypothetical protein
VRLEGEKKIIINKWGKIQKKKNSEKKNFDDGFTVHPTPF